MLLNFYSAETKDSFKEAEDFIFLKFVQQWNLAVI